MVYGVDECRLCGKIIGHLGPLALAQFNKAMSDPRPPMTEKQWRAKGFKAPPTRRQIDYPHEGCCFECQYKVALIGKTRPIVYMVSIVCVALAVLAPILLIAWWFH